MKEKTDEARRSWPIMEEFYTIQGEGFHSGKAAYFIRTGGCDVGCVWCDVKESWDAEKHPETTVDKLLFNTIKKSNATFAVITGGEPAMYDISTLVDALKAREIYTAIETSGCYPLKGDVDWYCFSPKKFKAPIAEAYERANELKIIIYNLSDFSWAEEHAKKVNADCELYLQPEWSKQARILTEIITYVKSNPKWKISLQTHKFMNIP